MKYDDWCESWKSPDSEARGQAAIAAAIIKRRRKALKRRRDAELTALGRDLMGHASLWTAEWWYIVRRMDAIRCGKVVP